MKAGLNHWTYFIITCAKKYSYCWTSWNYVRGSSVLCAIRL